MYYFVETLSVSAIVSSYTAPPKLADAAHSRKPIQTHQAIHRSLIVVNPNIDRLQWFGIGIQHLFFTIWSGLPYSHVFCSSQVFIIS